MTAAAFHYGPRERRGVVLGLTVAQVVAVFVGAALSLAVSRLFGGLLALPVMLGGLLLTAVAVAVVPAVSGITSYVATGLLGRRSWLVQPVRRLDFLPPELGVVSTTSITRNGRETGVYLDNGRPVGVLPVFSRGAFPLRDSDNQRAVLSSWGDFIASLAGAGSLISHVGQYDATALEEEGGLTHYYEGHSRGDNARARASYEALISSAAPAARRHEQYLAVALDTFRARDQVKAAGGGTAGQAAVLAEAMEAFTMQLDAVDLAAGDPLTEDELWLIARTHYDAGELDRQVVQSRAGLRRGVPAGTSLTAAREERWSMLRTDGGYHRTYWVEQFPRVAVGCDFLAPLLLSTTASRTVAIVSEPVDESVALGQAQRAAMRAGSDDAMRSKLRKRKTKHEERQDEVVARREDEIVDGAADTRTSGYVTVHAPTVEALGAACRDVEQQAVKARLRLTQLSRQQALAFTYTLPLCRGIRPTFGRKKK